MGWDSAKKRNLQNNNIPKIFDLAKGLRKIAQYLSKNIECLEKYLLIQLIPELPEFKRQSEKLVNSWDTHLTPTP